MKTTTARSLEEQIFVRENVRVVISASADYEFPHTYQDCFPTRLYDDALLGDLISRIRCVVGDVEFFVLNPVVTSLKVSAHQRMGDMRAHYKLGPRLRQPHSVLRVMTHYPSFFSAAAALGFALASAYFMSNVIARVDRPDPRTMPMISSAPTQKTAREGI